VLDTPIGNLDNLTPTGLNLSVTHCIQIEAERIEIEDNPTPTGLNLSSDGCNPLDVERVESGYRFSKLEIDKDLLT